MAWEGSDRRATLPPDWADRVKQVWKRDEGRCRWRLPSGKRCPRRGAEVDHRYSRSNHDVGALWLLCKTHHDAKTAKEAYAGKAKKKPPRRPPEAHPGLRRP